MTFKWPDPPSPYAPNRDLADFVEMTCWRDSRASYTDLSRLIVRLDENDHSNGVGEDEDAEGIAEEAYTEMERREEACRGGYPFVIGAHGNTLRYSDGPHDARQSVYTYLLLATRLNMSNNRDHAGIDGTRLFEELAAEVAREYFGERADSLVFGAEAGGAGFEQRVNDLCDQLKEGGGFSKREMGRIAARDGRLDIVAWKPFTDGLPGKLIGFGQCKTGTNYRDTVTQLQPDAFAKKWLVYSPAVSPMRMFFIAESLELSRERRYDISVDAGLLFDRCRIVDFSDRVDDGVLKKVRRWTRAAAEAAGLNGA